MNLNFESTAGGFLNKGELVVPFNNGKDYCDEIACWLAKLELGSKTTQEVWDHIMFLLKEEQYSVDNND